MIFATFNNITTDEIIRVSASSSLDILREYMNKCPGHSKFTVTFYDDDIDDTQCLYTGEGVVYDTSDVLRSYDAILNYRHPSSTIIMGRFIYPRKPLKRIPEIQL